MCVSHCPLNVSVSFYSYSLSLSDSQTHTHTRLVRRVYQATADVSQHLLIFVQSVFTRGDVSDIICPLPPHPSHPPSPLIATSSHERGPHKISLKNNTLCTGKFMRPIYFNHNSLGTAFQSNLCYCILKWCVSAAALHTKDIVSCCCLSSGDIYFFFWLLIFSDAVCIQVRADKYFIWILNLKKIFCTEICVQVPN